METPLRNFVIFDRNAGFLQWSCLAADATAALADFDAAVGIDPNGIGLDAIFADYDIREVTDDQRAAVETWQEQGAKASEFPLAP